MDISTGFEKSTNIQAEWPQMGMIGEKVRIGITSRVQQSTTVTHLLEGHGQT